MVENAAPAKYREKSPVDIFVDKVHNIPYFCLCAAL